MANNKKETQNKTPKNKIQWQKNKKEKREKQKRENIQKNKKNLSYLKHYKKTTNGIQFRNVDEKHSLIQIDNEKKLYWKPIIALLYVAILLFIEF